MARNIVLAVSSLAVLVLIFLGYTVLVGMPEGGPAAEPVVAELPSPDPDGPEPLRVADALEVPAGGKIVFKRYDERTGRPIDMFLCEDWQPVEGSKNEIRVSEPELATVIPGGMIVTVSAKAGQIAVDRVQQTQMLPKHGWLEGDVRIVLDRETAVERTPAEERPEDLVTVRMGRMDFDLEIGEMETRDAVSVRSDDFEIAGTGLHLIWNQADNRLETLSIRRGERLVLYTAAGSLGMMGAVGEGGDAKPKQPAVRQVDRRSGEGAAYRCVLTGDIVARQERGEQTLGALTAEQIELLFDVGGSTKRWLGGPTATSAPASQPESRPATQPVERERLVVEWAGPLGVEPVKGASGDGARRRFAAVGDPVVLERGEGRVTCGKVLVHDDTQRIWLYPDETGWVSFGMGPEMSATAREVFIDQRARVVKLVGDVRLESLRGRGKQGQVSAIRCAHWAELHIAGGGEADVVAEDEALIPASRLERATFVGDVEVALGEHELAGQRLDIGFAEAGKGTGRDLEALLESAVASGAVRLKSGDGELSCAELQIVFERAEGELYPQVLDARGAVEIRRGRAYLRGDRIAAELAAPVREENRRAATLVIRHLDVYGDAKLVEPEREYAAEGEWITAEFEGVNELAWATVRGTAAEHALVHAEPYTVRGEVVDLRQDGLTLHVDGPSRLTFKTRRSLQGQRRARPTPIVVSSGEMLHVDGAQNEVVFVGEVVAESEEERLYADRLTLLLEDVEEATTQPAGSSWKALWRRLTAQFVKQPAETGGGELFDVRLARQRKDVRKEPRLLLAENALVTSETVVSDLPVPVMEASIRAPRLDVDIVRRQIITRGLTQLLLLDRRMRGDAAETADAIGIPSALLSRGPSQTAMQCEGRMTYTLGEEGPGRRDSAVFEEEVFFVHRSGREMVHLSKMLPEAVMQPELVADLPDNRNASLSCDRMECWFAVDEPAGGARRGGALTEAPLELATLMAIGNVYLRDVQEPKVREVHADWIEFNREKGWIQVRGSETADARVYFENKQTGQADVHPGHEVTINLKDGTIRAERISGEMKR